MTSLKLNKKVKSDINNNDPKHINDIKNIYESSDKNCNENDNDIDEDDNWQPANFEDLKK